MDPGPLQSDGGRDNGTEYDESYHAYELSNGESVSEAVIRAASAVTGRSPLDLDPLFDAVDPDALDALFSNVGAQHNPSDVRVRFTYERCSFVVTRHDLYVRALEEDDDAD